MSDYTEPDDPFDWCEIEAVNLEFDDEDWDLNFYSNVYKVIGFILLVIVGFTGLTYLIIESYIK